MTFGEAWRVPHEYEYRDQSLSRVVDWRWLNVWGLQAPGLSCGAPLAARGSRHADMARHERVSMNVGNSADLDCRSTRRSTAARPLASHARRSSGPAALSRLPRGPPRADRVADGNPAWQGRGGGRRTSRRYARRLRLPTIGLSHETRPGDRPEVAWNRHRPGCTRELRGNGPRRRQDPGARAPCRRQRRNPGRSY
jgi:hypothetical protein